MADQALDIIEAQARRVKDRMVEGVEQHLADNLDSFPMAGVGFAFVRRSAEDALTRRLEERLDPMLEAHLETQIAFTRALAERDDADAVRDEFADDLLETDPLWDVLNDSEAVRDEAREAILEGNAESCARAAEWMEDAGGQEFDDYAELVAVLGKTPDEAVEELNTILYYVELMEDYREHIDASGYSSVLDSDRVHDWFVEHFLRGLKKSEDAVLDEVREDLEARLGEEA